VGVWAVAVGLAHERKVGLEPAARADVLEAVENFELRARFLNGELLARDAEDLEALFTVLLLELV
jgi:hypothetical protein